MAHGPETDALIQQAQAFVAGQDWTNEKLSDDDKSAIEVAVMHLVAMAAREEPIFVAAVEAFRKGGT
jgi:hypothetical protein